MQQRSGDALQMVAAGWLRSPASARPFSMRISGLTGPCHVRSPVRAISSTQYSTSAHARQPSRRSSGTSGWRRSRCRATASKPEPASRLVVRRTRASSAPAVDVEAQVVDFVSSAPLEDDACLRSAGAHGGHADRGWRRTPPGGVCEDPAASVRLRGRADLETVGLERLNPVGLVDGLR